MTFSERPIKKGKKPYVEINWKIREIFLETSLASVFENMYRKYS